MFKDEEIDQFLTTREVCERYGVSEEYLAKQRRLGRPPDFVRFSRAIRYPKSALDRWVHAAMRRGTFPEERPE
jgi:predicted DNA-binding transcriptional regulator AlpA